MNEPSTVIARISRQLDGPAYKLLRSKSELESFEALEALRSSASSMSYLESVSASLARAVAQRYPAETSQSRLILAVDRSLRRLMSRATPYKLAAEMTVDVGAANTASFVPGTSYLSSPRKGPLIGTMSRIDLDTTTLVWNGTVQNDGAQWNLMLSRQAHGDPTPSVRQVSIADSPIINAVRSACTVPSPASTVLAALEANTNRSAAELGRILQYLIELRFVTASEHLEQAHITDLQQHRTSQPSSARLLHSTNKQATQVHMVASERAVLIGSTQLQIPNYIVKEVQRTSEAIHDLRHLLSSRKSIPPELLWLQENFAPGSLVALEDVVSEFRRSPFRESLPYTVRSNEVQEAFAASLDALATRGNNSVRLEDLVEKLSEGRRESADIKKLPSQVARFRVDAKDLNSLADGRATVRMLGGSLVPGATVGRFLKHLNYEKLESLRTRIANTLSSSEALLRVQVLYSTVDDRWNDVLCSTPIGIGAHMNLGVPTARHAPPRDSRAIPIEDVMVYIGSKDIQFFHKKDGKRLLFYAFDMLIKEGRAPLLVQFLVKHSLPAGGTPTQLPIPVSSFGKVVPSVVSGRTVVTPAQTAIRRADIEYRDRASLLSSIAKSIDTLGNGGRVAIRTGVDQRLVYETASWALKAQLEAHLARKQEFVLEECHPLNADGWSNNQSVEIEQLITLPYDNSFTATNLPKGKRRMSYPGFAGVRPSTESGDDARFSEYRSLKLHIPRSLTRHALNALYARRLIHFHFSASTEGTIVALQAEIDSKLVSTELTNAGVNLPERSVRAVGEIALPRVADSQTLSRYVEFSVGSVAARCWGESLDRRYLNGFSLLRRFIGSNLSALELKRPENDPEVSKREAKAARGAVQDALRLIRASEHSIDLNDTSFTQMPPGVWGQALLYLVNTALFETELERTYFLKLIWTLILQQDEDNRGR